MLVHFSQALRRHCDVEVLNNAKSTAPDRSLVQGIAAQLKLLARLSRILWQWRPDVVHIHTCSEFTFWRNGLDLLLARLFARPVVLHIHGARFHEFLGGLSPRRARVARLILHSAGRVVVLGKVWEERLRPWCTPGTIDVVPNGVAISPEELSPAAQARTILCVANYEKRKGLEDLVRAVAALRNARLILVGGEAEAGHRKTLESLASELGIGDRVDVAGPKRFDEVVQYFKVSGIFCLPSYNEGLPMALLEAMAHGLPVVATRVGSIPEAVEHAAEGYLYDAGDIPALTSCLERLLADSGAARSMGHNARQRVAREFGVEAMARRILDVYGRLLPDRTQPHGAGGKILRHAGSKH